MLKIKKTGEETTYEKISKTHTFEINNKIVRVYSFRVDDPEMDNYDADDEIDEKDAEELTEEEFEAIGENMEELLTLKDGEDYEAE